jgi:phytoene synthase
MAGRWHDQLAGRDSELDKQLQPQRMNSSTPESYCREKAAPAGSSLYYSTLYYPADIKRKLNAVHAFHCEIEQIINECSDPGVAHMKLAWWQEEIRRLFAGEARHPVSRELSQVILHHEISASALPDLIRHYEQRIHPAWPGSWQAMMEYLAPGPGTVWKYSAAICGYSQQQTPEIVCRMGSLFGLFYLLQDRRRYQLLQPEQTPDYLHRLGVELEECCSKIACADLMPQTGPLIMANIILQTANEIARDSGSPATQRTTLTPLRKFWIAWRTHRKMMK